MCTVLRGRSPNARTVNISGATRTILVGGVGAGGKGLYALDITDPVAADEAAAASKILWEITDKTINNITDSSYADLGYTYGVPLIVKLNDGTWAAIVGNGYNNRGSDQAVLYVINLLTGAKIAGITATVTGTSDDSNANGLSSPTAIDTNNDGKVDYVYAGDINGNLWKFDLTSTTSGSWSATKLYHDVPGAGDHREARGRVTSGRRLHGHLRDGPHVLQHGRHRHVDVLYVYGIRDNGTTIDPAKIVAQTLTEKT